MKRIRRTISILLCAAMLMSVIVTVSVASSTQVKKVNMFADVPYAGRVADFSARAGADAEENGYGVYYFNDFGDGSYSSVEWYDETAGYKLRRGDTFIKGHDYRLRIGIAASTGYEFAYSRTVADNGVSTYYSNFDEVTLNGEDATFRHFMYKDYKKYLYIERRYPAVTDTPASAIVDEVAVKNLDYPMAGNAPDFDVTTASDGYGLHDNSAYSVNWYAVKGEYLIELDRDDVFTVGTTYRVYVTLKANYGWRFKYDNPETPNLKSVKINGLSANYAKNYAYERDVFDKELKISYTFGPCPGDKVSQIDIVGVTAPAAGQTPSYSAVMLTDACVFSDYEDSKNKNGACWYDYTAGDFVRTTDTFIEGHEYSITFELLISDGYSFDKGNVTATVNGNDAEVHYYSEGDTKHYVEYRFAPCFGGEYIESVDITNVAPPVAGNYPLYSATVPEGCTITYIDWGLEDINEKMNPADTFKNGNTYSVIVKVAVADSDSYRFSDNVTVTVNGKTAEYNTTDTGELRVTYVFPPCTASDVINDITITNVVPPMPGEKPVFNASVSEGCTIQNIEWGLMDEMCKIEADHMFAEGNVYRIAVTVSVSDPAKYRFGDDLYVTVNGIEATEVHPSMESDGTIVVCYDFKPCTVSIPGDVNRDTKINLADVSLMLKYIAKWNVEPDLGAADVTGDGKVNLGDVSLLLKFIAKWDVVLK